MNGEVSSLWAEVGADVSKFDKAMQSVDDGLSFAGKSMDSFGSIAMGAFMRVGELAVEMAANIAGVVVDSISSAVTAAADMEQGIADIGAMMNLTSEDTAKLQDHIMELGLSPDLKVSATEASSAVMALGTSGLEMAEIMGGASEATIRLANATGLKGESGFASAANIATDVMTQFNIEAADMDAAVSAIAGTTVASKLTIDDYRLALGQAGGVASGVGVDFEDFNAILAATAPSFTSGSDAGTSFKTFLTTLIPKSNEAKDMMIQLGLATADGTSKFYDASGSLKSAEEIAGLLHDTMGGLTEAQLNNATATIFGTDASRTAIALVKGGIPLIEEMKTAIGNVDAEELAAKRMDTLRGSWEIFQGVVETLQLAMGEKLLPIARKVIDWTTELAQKYGPPVIEWVGVLADKVAVAVDWLMTTIATGLNFTEVFESMPEPIQAVINGVEGVVSAVGDFIQWVTDTFQPVADLIAQHVSWTDVIIGTATAITAMLLPAITGAMAAGVAAAGAFIAAMIPVVVPIAAAIAAVAALRYAWETDLGGIREITAEVWSIITEIFGNVITSLGDVLEEFKVKWALVGDENLALSDRLTIIWEAMKDAAIVLFAGIVEGVVKLLVPFTQTLEMWGQASQQWIIDATEPVRVKLQEYLDNVIAWGNSVLTNITDKFNEVKDAVVDRVTTFVETSRNTIEQWRSWLVDKYQSIHDGIADKMELIKTAVLEPVRNFVEMAQDKITGWQNWIIDKWESIRSAIAERMEAIKNAVSEPVRVFIENTQNKIEGWRDWLVDKWESVRNSIAERMESIKNAVLEPVKNFVQETQERIAGWHDYFVDLVGRIRDGAAERFGQMQTGISDWLNNVGFMWRGGWGQMSDQTAKSTGDVTDNVKSSSGIWKGTWEDTLEYLTWWTTYGWRDAFYNPIYKWILDTTDYIQYKWNKTVDDLKAIWIQIVDTAKDKWNVFSVEVTDIVMTFIDKVTHNIENWIAVTKSNFELWIGWVQKYFGDWRDWLVDLFTGVWDKIQEIFPVSEWVQWGKDLIQGLWDGMKSAWNTFTSWLDNAWESIKTNVNVIFQRHSPSQWFADLGGDLMAGLQSGINDASSAPVNAIQGVADQMKGKMTTMVGDIGSLVTAINNILAQIQMPQIPNTPTIPTVPTTPTTPLPTVPASSIGALTQIVDAPMTSLKDTRNAIYDQLQNVVGADQIDAIKGLAEKNSPAYNAIKESFYSLYDPISNLYSDFSENMTGNEFTQMVQNMASEMQDVFQSTQTNELFSDAVKEGFGSVWQKLLGPIALGQDAGELFNTNQQIGIADEMAEQAAATMANAVKAAVPNIADFTSKTIEQLMDTIAPTNASIDKNIFFDRLNDFAQDVGAGLTQIFGKLDDEASAAYDTVQYGNQENINALLAAVQVLIQKLSAAGLGTTFNYNAAPGDVADQREELGALIAYLNALYA